jgi:DNA-binding CsgD family transcriptional regulator
LPPGRCADRYKVRGSFPIQWWFELVHKISVVLNAARLIDDFQQVNKIGQSISGCLEPGVIAHRITDGLVAAFDAAFARIWLTDPDGRSLNLVASSGLYTHLNGSFAQVPMGAYKVGKIAQNRVPFLSNRLADEAWVKDRDWAIANCLQGFAGYPLVAGDGRRLTQGDRVLGVLVTFSHAPLDPEFLEVLQLLCLTATIALDAAMQFPRSAVRSEAVPLSDALALALSATRLTLVGTECDLPPTVAHVLLRSVEVLEKLDCRYCRLTYGGEQVMLEGLVRQGDPQSFETVKLLTHWLGGSFQRQLGPDNRLLEIQIEIPYQTTFSGLPIAPVSPIAPVLSDRERKIMVLLAQGMRDREISQSLHISESTVKFHINNCLSKLQAKNRYQAIYEAAKRDWI